MKIKFEKARFYIETGPPSLFTRVQYVMSMTVFLNLSASHFNLRVIERNIPDSVIEKLKKFNIDEWQLKTAEVRIDKGKFINSTWEIIIDELPYWITIGFNDTIQTIVRKSTIGFGNITKSGEIYDFVEKVNYNLMIDDIGNSGAGY